MKIIPYGNHFVDKEDAIALGKSTHTKFLTSGQYGVKFHDKLKKYINSKYLVLSSSGTSALHLAFMAIGLNKDDAIIMPSINFIASYNMATQLNAKIYLADVDPYTGQMTPKNVEKCIKDNKIKKIKCILTMYLGGSPENIKSFSSLKKKYKSFLIEDSCHAFGSSYLFNKKKTMVGCNKHSDISTFSFHPVKSIATGEGGCITTNSKKIYEKVLELKNHGMIKNKKKHWDYDVVSNGYNYRISDINCALGISQLKKINKFSIKRNKIAKVYRQELMAYSDYLTFPNYSDDNYSCYHLLILNFKFDKLKKNKEYFFSEMLKNKILFQFHYKPIYKFKIFNIYLKMKLNFPGSEYFYKNCLSAPIFYNLKKNELKYIIYKIKLFINKYKKY